MNRKLAREIEGEAEQWPGVSISFGHRRKHPVINLAYRNRTRFVAVSGTCSDNRRAVKNIIRDVRHTLTGLGAKKVAE